MTSSIVSTPTSGRARWWRTLGSWCRTVFAHLRCILLNPSSPARPPATGVSQRHRFSRPIIVHARGSVFTFEIDVVLDWHADQLSPDHLGAWSVQFAGLARRDVERQAADLARHFHPHQAGEMEYQLNRALSGRQWRYERRGLVLRCHPEVRVRLDAEVREQLRAIHLQKVQEEGEHELLLRRAQRTEQLTRRWIAVIERLRRSPLARAAAHLTDEHLATVIDQYVVADEKTNIELLATRLEEALRRSGRVGEPLEAHEAEEIINLLNDVLANEPDLLSTAYRPTANGSTGH